MSNISVRERVLRWRKEIIFGFVLALVSSLSFALGYLTGREGEVRPIIIEKAAPLTTPAGEE